MVDLLGKDKGNISLSVNLQSWDDDKEQSKPTIINTQRAFYEIKIEDIENRIKRLEDRNEELLEEIEVTEESSATVDAETADEITNLSKQFYAQDARVEDLKAKIHNVEDSRIKEKQLHNDRVESLNERYEKKKIELTSQNKVLTAKINGLEDFKKTQHGLEDKFELNEKQMIENEERVKELLEIVSRKFEFDKEMLRNEMYNCLLDLAAQFQVQTDKHISLPNKRLMRENIMLKNELWQISKQVSLQKNIESFLKSSSVDHKKKSVKKSSYVRQNIVTAKIQNAVLKCLKKKFENTKEHFSSVTIPDLAMENKYLTSIENARYEEDIVNLRLSKLTVMLEKERARIGTAKYLNRKLNCKIKAIIETLYDLKYIVKCLLKCPDKYPDIAQLNCVQLLLFLRNIFITGHSKVQCNIIKSVETIPGVMGFLTKDLEDEIYYGFG
ncbi:uncharacterized protein LOC105663778 isoform X2 [Megachile rotundata]|uniref:uncharacterized protein LOC105663778 isoform X2 n=1 Tax=Megachile rotundata TaxID=143995 RepID=UPI003FD40121